MAEVMAESETDDELEFLRSKTIRNFSPAGTTKLYRNTVHPAPKFKGGFTFTKIDSVDVLPKAINNILI